MSIVHALPSSQTSGVPVLQVPAIVQVSNPLHALLSEHEVPPGSGAYAQPVAGSQASAVHASLSLQVSAVPGVHEPSELHTSPPLHRFPSEHEAPVFGVAVHPVAGLQASVVQVLLSSQVSGTPATHAPAMQNSAPSH